MTADFSLYGQVALVTGASSGLGRSFAGFLADAGASVIVAARRAEKCAEAAEEIGGETLAVGMDVMDADSIEAALTAAEEQFGPVMPLMKFSSEEEVIQRANNTEYGLAGAVWTNDADKGVEIAEQLETGTVWVNEFLHLNPLAPFGGHKQSGFGVEYGLEGLKEFTYAQVVTVKRDSAQA